MWFRARASDIRYILWTQIKLIFTMASIYICLCSEQYKISSKIERSASSRSHVTGNRRPTCQYHADTSKTNKNRSSSTFPAPNCHKLVTAHHRARYRTESTNRPTSRHSILTCSNILAGCYPRVYPLSARSIFRPSFAPIELRRKITVQNFRPRRMKIIHWSHFRRDRARNRKFHPTPDAPAPLADAVIGDKLMRPTQLARAACVPSEREKKTEEDEPGARVDTRRARAFSLSSPPISRFEHNRGTASDFLARDIASRDREGERGR